MGKQQTAVEWLKQKLLLSPKPIYNSEIEKYFDQAKQMEREQIEECGRVMYNNGVIDSGLAPSDYYTQTYGQ